MKVAGHAKEEVFGKARSQPPRFSQGGRGSGRGLNPDAPNSGVPVSYELPYPFEGLFFKNLFWTRVI